MAFHSYNDQSLASLEATVKLVQERLTDSQIDVLDKVPGVLCRLVSDSNASRLLQLAHDSISMCDGTLAVTMQAELSTEKNAAATNGTVFYVRSISVTCGQLRLILEMYHQRYYDPVFVHGLLRHLSHKSSDDTVALRYVGCTSKQTPYMRHLRDLSSNEASATRYANMVALLGELFDGGVQVNIYSIPLLQLQGDEPNDSSLPGVDATEQILIHLFGRQLLLNVHPGGHLYPYMPQLDDQTCARNLALTNARQYLINDTNVFGSHHAQKEVLTIFQGFRAQLVTIDTRLASMLPDEYLKYITMQAALHTSCVPGGFTPLAIFGKDAMVEDAHLRRGFFDGCRAGAMAQMAIQLVLEDERINSKNVSVVDLWMLVSILPMLASAIETAARVLRQVKCLTMVTMGYLPAAIARSKFHGRQSLTEEDYAMAVGDPFITNFDVDYSLETAPADQMPDDHCWAVVIPHIDPTALSYGSCDLRVHRLVFLCWVRSLLLLDCCITAMQAAPAKGLNSPGTRGFAENLVALLQQREARSDLPVRIEEARHAVIEMRRMDTMGQWERTIFRNENMRDDELCALPPMQSGNVGLSNDFDRYGVVRGKPYSPDRESQYVALMRYDDAMFHQCRSYVHDHSAWREWFLSLEQGATIWRSLVQRIRAETNMPLGDLIEAKVNYLKTQCKAPPGFEDGDDSWMLSPDLVSQALRERAATIWRGPWKVRNKMQLQGLLAKRSAQDSMDDVFTTDDEFDGWQPKGRKRKRDSAKDDGDGGDSQEGGDEFGDGYIPPPSKRANKTKTALVNTQPFWLWWRTFHDNTNQDIVFMDFEDFSHGFWYEMQQVAQSDEVNSGAIKQFVSMRDLKQTRSLNAVARSYGWKVEKVKNAVYQYTAPNTFAPEEPLATGRITVRM